MKPGGGGGGGGGGGTRVHHGQVGSAGLCDLKILHPWRRLKEGVKILQWPPPTLEKGGQYSTSVWKVCKKGGQKSTILKNIGVKILQVWKWGSKFYMLKNRGQNSTMLEKRGVNILHPTPKVEVKILHRLKKGGQSYLAKHMSVNLYKCVAVTKPKRGYCTGHNFLVKANVLCELEFV